MFIINKFYFGTLFFRSNFFAHMKVRMHFFYINVKFGMFTLHYCTYIPQRYLSGTYRWGLKKSILFGVQKFVPNLGQLMFTLSAKNGGSIKMNSYVKNMFLVHYSTYLI